MTAATSLGSKVRAVGSVLNCSHSLCDDTTGVPLKSGCNACVTAVCNNDSFCCNNDWDSVCVSEVDQYCTQPRYSCCP
jgi:hypothetical protein